MLSIKTASMALRVTEDSDLAVRMIDALGNDVGLVSSIRATLPAEWVSKAQKKPVKVAIFAVTHCKDADLLDELEPGIKRKTVREALAGNPVLHEHTKDRMRERALAEQDTAVYSLLRKPVPAPPFSERLEAFLSDERHLPEARYGEDSFNSGANNLFGSDEITAEQIELLISTAVERGFLSVAQRFVEQSLFAGVFCPPSRKDEVASALSEIDGVALLKSLDADSQRQTLGRVVSSLWDREDNELLDASMARFIVSIIPGDGRLPGDGVWRSKPKRFFDEEAVDVFLAHEGWRGTAAHNHILTDAQFEQVVQMAHVEELELDKLVVQAGEDRERQFALLSYMPNDRYCARTFESIANDLISAEGTTAGELLELIRLSVAKGFDSWAVGVCSDLALHTFFGATRIMVHDASLYSSIGFQRVFDMLGDEKRSFVLGAVLDRLPSHEDLDTERLLDASFADNLIASGANLADRRGPSEQRRWFTQEATTRLVRSSLWVGFAARALVLSDEQFSEAVQWADTASVMTNLQGSRSRLVQVLEAAKARGEDGNVASPLIRGALSCLRGPEDPLLVDLMRQADADVQENYVVFGVSVGGEEAFAENGELRRLIDHLETQRPGRLAGRVLAIHPTADTDEMELAHKRTLLEIVPGAAWRCGDPDFIYSRLLEASGIEHIELALEQFDQNSTATLEQICEVTRDLVRMMGI